MDASISSNAKTVVPAYQDRSTGLTIFGIMTILLGCLAGLFALLLLVARMAASRNPRAAATMGSVLPAIYTYGGLGVTLIWLGIGSIMPRRWARALLLIFSWSWLVLGAFTTVFMTYFIPKMLHAISNARSANQPAIQPGTIATVMVVVLSVLGVFFVLLPAIWTFFYSSRHVKATCEARDDVECWTDACPLPVLGLCLWLALSMPILLMTALGGNAVMPFFGMFLTDIPATLLCLVTAILWGFAALLMYDLRPLGWWLILIVMILFMTSSLMTFARHDIFEMYRLMGFPMRQLNQMRDSGLLAGNSMIWFTALSAVPFLIYLLCLKKYFRSQT